MKLLIAKHVCHSAHVLTHMTYLGLVFMESHGYYGIAAGVLFCVVTSSEYIDRKIHKASKKKE